MQFVLVGTRIRILTCDEKSVVPGSPTEGCRSGCCSRYLRGDMSGLTDFCLCTTHCWKSRPAGLHLLMGAISTGTGTKQVKTHTSCRPFHQMLVNGENISDSRQPTGIWWVSVLEPYQDPVKTECWDQSSSCIWRKRLPVAVAESTVTGTYPHSFWQHDFPKSLMSAHSSHLRDAEACWVEHRD